MQRNLLNALIAWKNQPVRKPLLIDGARQTGKTYLLQELFGNTFANILVSTSLKTQLTKKRSMARCHLTS